METTEEKIKFIQSKGWSKYYNENYYVNPKTITDRKRQDFTNYGLSIEDAYKFEKRIELSSPILCDESFHSWNEYNSGKVQFDRMLERRNSNKLSDHDYTELVSLTKRIVKFEYENGIGSSNKH